MVRADHFTNESETNNAAKPVALEDDAPNEEEDVKSNSSEEANILKDGDACGASRKPRNSLDALLENLSFHNSDMVSGYS